MVYGIYAIAIHPNEPLIKLSHIRLFWSLETKLPTDGNKFSGCFFALPKLDFFFKQEQTLILDHIIIFDII